MRKLHIVYVTATSMLQRPLMRIIGLTQLSMPLWLKRYVKLLFVAVANSNKMKELHPHFRFHTGDWLTYHLIVTHCQAMNRTFAKLGDDPDLDIYQAYMKRQKHSKQKDVQQTLKRCRIEPTKRLVLPGQKVRPYSPLLTH